MNYHEEIAQFLRNLFEPQGYFNIEVATHKEKTK